MIVAAKSLQSPVHTLILNTEPGKGEGWAREFTWVFRDLCRVPLVKQLGLQQVW